MMGEAIFDAPENSVQSKPYYSDTERLMKAEGSTSGGGGYHTDGGIARRKPEQNGGILRVAPLPQAQEEVELRVRGPTRGDDAEEIARLKGLVRSLRGQLAVARGDDEEYGSDYEEDDKELPMKSKSDAPVGARHCRRLRRFCPRCQPARNYDETSIVQLITSRSGWLCLFLLSLLLTSLVIEHFEAALKADLELANFLPLLIGHGGNAGGQVVSTILAALAARRIHPRDGWRVAAKEGLAGLGAGTVTALVSVPFLMMMTDDLHAGITVPLAILVLTAMANVVAASLPFLVLHLNLNPNVISAPAMTTIVDVGGIAIYFYIAQAVVVMFGLDR